MRSSTVAIDIVRLWAPDNLRRVAPGVAGLEILDQAGIAGAVVSAMSARIGDGRSTLLEGFLSEVNTPAYRLGARIGSSALAFALAVAEKAS